MPLVYINPYRAGAADPNFSNVSLLLHFDGADNSTTVTDQKGKTINVFGTARLRTTDKVFGTASLYKPGGGSKINTANHADFNFGTGSFTVETWVKIVAIGNGLFIFSKNASGTNLQLYHVQTNRTVQMIINSVAITTATAIALNTWTHLAFVRNGTATAIYINGVSSATGTNSHDFSDSWAVGIGDYTHTNFSTSEAYFDEYRVTKGIARYTANFTPPAAPFADS